MSKISVRYVREMKKVKKLQALSIATLRYMARQSKSPYITDFGIIYIHICVYRMGEKSPYTQTIRTSDSI